MDKTTTEKEPVETTTPAAPAEEQTQEDNETTVEETTQSPASEDEQNDEEDDGIDYAAELERRTSQLTKAEHTAEQLRKENKILKRGGKPPVDNPDEDEEADPVDIDSIVDQKVNARMQDFVADTVETITESLSSNPDERKLILHFYNHKIQKSGYSRASIREDLELARAMANSGKLARENSELKRTVRTKKTIVNSTRGTNQDRQHQETKPAVKLSPADQKIMDRYKIKPDEIKTGGVVG